MVLARIWLGGEGAKSITNAKAKHAVYIYVCEKLNTHCLGNLTKYYCFGIGKHVYALCLVSCKL